MTARLLFILLILATITTVIQAQDSEPETWSIIERCLPEPTLPDEDWTFDGEILMRGWAGIHAVSAKFDTPYVVHWGLPFYLSPDGQHVLLEGYAYYTQQNTSGGPLGFYNFEYYGIDIVNIKDKTTQTFPWSAFLSISSGPYPYGPAGPIWLDENSFVMFYEWGGGLFKVGHLDTGEITDWEGIDLRDFESSISPDQTRAISYNHVYSLSDNSEISENKVGTDYDLQTALWAADSSRFADVVTNYLDYTTRSMEIFLSIFDRDGNLMATPMMDDEFGFRPLAWSPDANYLAVEHYQGWNSTNRGYVVDLSEEVVYDLCTDFNGFAWSPDGTQFATLLGDGQQPVVIVDMEEWQPYIAAYHTGYVLMWKP